MGFFSCEKALVTQMRYLHEYIIENMGVCLNVVTHVSMEVAWSEQ